MFGGIINRTVITILLIVLSIISILMVMNFEVTIDEAITKKEGKTVYFKSGKYLILKESKTLKILEYDGYEDVPIITFDYFDADGTFIQVGWLREGKYYLNENHSYTRTLLPAFTFILLMWYVIRYGPQDYITIRDWWAAKTKKPLVEKSMEDQQALIGYHINCSRCREAPDFTITNEEETHGMIFIHGHCNVCDEDKKVRIK